MNKTSAGLVVLGIVMGIIVYMGLTSPGLGGEYAYTCEDGTAFSITPAEDFSSITVYPTRNAEVFAQHTLPKVESNTGALYVGGETVFFGRGEQVQLITAKSATSTPCTPVQKKDSAPVSWGD